MSSSLEKFCGSSLNNYTIWQHNRYGYCYEKLVFEFFSHILLGLVSAFYVCKGQTNKAPTSPNLKKSTVICTRLAIAVLSATIPALRFMLKQFTGNPEPKRVDYLVDMTSCIAWLLMSVYLWRLRFHADDLARTHTPMILAWMLTLVSQCVCLSTVIKQLQNDDSTLPGWEEAIVITASVLQALYLLTLLLGPIHTSEYHDQAYDGNNEGREMLLLSSDGKISVEIPLGIAEENANLLSLITFWWVRAIMRKGSKGQLKNAHDVFSLPKTLTPSYVENYFSSVFPQGPAAFAEEVFISNKRRNIISDSNEFTSKSGYGSTKVGSIDQGGDKVSPKRIGNEPHVRKISVLRALFKAYGVRYILLGILKLSSNVFTFAGPMLLHALVRFMENEDEPTINGYLYAFGLLLSTLLLALIETNHGYQISKVRTGVHVSLVTTLYRKTLAVSATGLSSFTTGEIVNFMALDTRRINKAITNVHIFFNLPIKVVVAMYLLYSQVGVACLSGLGYILLLIPLTRFVLTKILNYHDRMMKRKDGRIKMMNEILNGIRVIKFYAWEKHFKKQIDELRSRELENLKGIKYLGAFNVFIWSTAPLVISLLIFSTYALTGNQLTAAKVFTSLALLNILRQPLKSSTRVMNNMMEAWVSINRIQHFIDLDDSDLARYYNTGTSLADGEILSIQGGTFEWGTPKQKKNNRKRGRNKVQDTTNSKEGIRADYIKLEPTDDKKHQETVVLDGIDLNIYRGQLVGVIGRVGSGKSSLFSAILADMVKKTGSISVAGLGEEFGLATQEPWIQHATIKENILFGREYKALRYFQVLEACALLPDLKILPAGDDTEVGEKGITLSGGQKARVALARAVYQECEIYLLDDPLSAVDADVAQHIFSKCIMELLANKTRILCTHHTRFLVDADLVVVMDGFKIVDKGPPSVVFHHPKYAEHMKHSKIDGDKKEEETLDSGTQGSSEDKLVEAEKKEEGALNLNIYKSYAVALGIILASIILASFVLMQVFKSLSDLWLSHWVSDTRPNIPFNETTQSNSFHLFHYHQPEEYGSPDPKNITSSGPFLVYYVGIYGGLVLMNLMLTLLRSFLFAYGGLRAAAVIHKNLLISIMKAPIYFFDKTPVGRIFNRFSSDIMVIDIGLTQVMGNMLTEGISVIGIVLVTCYSLPWFIVCLIPMTIVYYYVQDYYRKTSRELRRITNIANSSVYSHFGESIAGLAVIKGMRATKRFRLENQKRLELYQRAMFSDLIVNCWLSFRLQLIGVSMVTAVAVIAVIEHHHQGVDPGLVGLAMTYALSITNMLMPFINTMAESEKNMISVERTNHYTIGIPHEPQDGLIKPPHFWPIHGVVKFSNVQFWYRDYHPKALNGVSFETRPGEKVGIVGRTGAGKSTLFLVLFRMVAIQKGYVTIDGINLADLSLENVRSRLAIIPQDPFLFSGSVRRNLDPVGQFSDSELWCVLEKCHIKDVVTRMGGLEASAGEGGKQFSTGQKQLICLARAMLTKAKVLCIDEATASVDMATDDLLQQAIKEEFQDNTILTIAHRLNTLRDSDRILVMDEGTVAKFEKIDVTTVDI